MATVLNSGNKVVKYGVKVGGKVISSNHTSRTLAENFVGGLNADQQQLAEIVQVDENGKEILFG